ncbi:hypothetical protein CY35_08G046800, partial [Sphagnum magellanicum]
RIQVRVRCASPSAPVGLIKKASELSILCGTHVGIVVFSQARKAFSFGHHYIDCVIEKTLLMRNAVGRLTDDDDDDAEQKVLQVQALEQQQKQVLQLLAAEKKLNQRLLCQPFWWRQSVAVSSGIHELQYVQQRIDALYQLLVTRASCLQQQQQQHTA